MQTSRLPQIEWRIPSYITQHSDRNTSLSRPSHSVSLQTNCWQASCNPCDQRRKKGSRHDRITVSVRQQNYAGTRSPRALLGHHVFGVQNAFAEHQFTLQTQGKPVSPGAQCEPCFLRRIWGRDESLAHPKSAMVTDLPCKPHRSVRFITRLKNSRTQQNFRPPIVLLRASRTKPSGPPTHAPNPQHLPRPCESSASAAVDCRRICLCTFAARIFLHPGSTLQGRGPRV